MSKNLLRKLINKEDLKEASLNFAVAWTIGKTAVVISEKFFHFSLNKYNSVDHFAIGVGVGSYAYRRAGKGAKGVLAGIIAATLFNGCWEYAEYKGNIFRDSETLIDTFSDIACVYTGSIFGFLGEKLKRKS